MTGAQMDEANAFGEQDMDDIAGRGVFSLHHADLQAFDEALAKYDEAAKAIAPADAYNTWVMPVSGTGFSASCPRAANTSARGRAILDNGAPFSCSCSISTPALLAQMGWVGFHHLD